MNNSTEGVTLYAGFISDLLLNYQENKNTFAAGLFELTKNTDLSDPTARVPIKLYNDMADWIIKNLGPASLRKAGEVVGARAHLQMVQGRHIGPNSTPQDILQALKEIADIMVQDPLGRGWTILEKGEKHVVMRRTQTFNPVLQEGLLKALVTQHSEANFVIVKYLKSVRQGDEFDEFEITWI